MGVESGIWDDSALLRAFDYAMNKYKMNMRLFPTALNTDLLNAWYSVGVFTGKYLAERSIEKRSS